MHKELRVEVISPAGYLFNDSCYLITVPSIDGEIGFMANHESVLANLKEGKIIIFDKSQTLIKEFPVVSGFAEMFDNKLLVLIDA